MSDLFEADSPDGTVPERHMVRIFEPWPEPTRSRLVYPMWTMDVGADGEIDKAVDLAEELMAFDAEARLTWVIHPLATKRWSTDPGSPWSRELCAFGDRHGSRATVVLYDTGDESQRDIQRLHEGGFPVLTPAPGNPYYVEVLRPSGWIAGCVAPVLAPA